MNTSFFGDMLQSIAERGRALVTRDRRGVAEQRSANLAHLCEDLLSRRGEASGVALAREILSRYAELKTGPRIAFFEALASGFGPDRARLSAAATAWMNAPSDAAASKLHRASEPRRLELFRRLNLAPGGTAALVRMRAQLLEAMDHRDDLAAIDDDFLHLFSSWFNRGFLVLRTIDWSTPANLLEKIIRYEAVHAIRDWNDLRARIDSPDRRCYAFFHPALIDEPLIFVEVALTRGIPAAIEPILSAKRERIEPERATTAVFYSISNCQRGLAGVSFGHFLIKQVVEEVGREIPRLSTFVTLVAGAELCRMAQARARERGFARAQRRGPRRARRRSTGRIGGSDEVAAENVREPLLRAAAWYYLRARTPPRRPARFGRALPSRQRRAARAAEFRRRHLRAGAAAIARLDGELPLRPRAHRAEPRGLCPAARRRCRQRGHAPRQGAGA